VYGQDRSLFQKKDLMFFIKRKSGIPKLFISVGAGFNQIPLISELKKCGYYVIGIDQNCSAAGLLCCDIRIQESIYNYEAIYRKIQELLIDGEIKGVLTRSFGAAVKSTAFISEKVSIPYIDFRTVDNLIDKRKMKHILTHNKIRNPSMITIKDPVQIKNFPCVIKPLKGHAKKGVRYIKNASDARNYFVGLEGNDKEFLAESYIAGDEIIAAGIACKRKFTLVEITDKLVSELPSFVDVQHSAPSKYIHRWNEIAELGQKIVESFGIITSPLFYEIRIDGEGNLFVIEVIPEFGGEFLADHLIPARSGFNFIKNSIQAIAGGTVSAHPKRKYKKAVVVKYITSQKNGILASFSPLPRIIGKNIIYSAIFKDVGAEVRPPETNHDRIGVVIATGTSVEAAAAEAAETIRKYNIKIKEVRKK
jgi:biotin carboxylase